MLALPEAPFGQQPSTNINTQRTQTLNPVHALSPQAAADGNGAAGGATITAESVAARAASTLTTLDTIKAAYQASLQASLAPLLDGTNEARYQLQDVNFVVDEVGLGLRV